MAATRDVATNLAFILSGHYMARNKNLRSSVVGSEIWDLGRMFSVPGLPPFSLYDVILQNLVSILV